MKIINTKNHKETEKQGISFAKKLKRGDFVALYGQLGAGKTTFIQGIMKGLGIKKRIVSPTFIIIRMYESEEKKMNVYHLDLYRIESVDDLPSIGFEDILKDEKGIVLVEWAEKIKNVLPKKRFDVYFEYMNKNCREIKIQNG
ncbi:tRNA (adenosine(37)-N6)-threonylcarbamoyltransferase complex ATPase subunit type 1 TsaE [Patescibacteria group bacterium]|nr:tRNA (adenosine(37)-N6)-threonylcarbamoyltransferase complex ATPase subunit type 1 TsaE [Patescibacteria group bacterium]